MPFTKTDADGLRMTTIATPDFGLGLAPTIARFGEYLVIATTPDLVRNLARVGENPPPLLRDDPTFQRFSKMEPPEGNAFTYLSERGADILREIQMISAPGDPAEAPATRDLLTEFTDVYSQKFLYSVTRLKADGLHAVTYSSQGTEQVVATLALIPTALLAGTAVPAINQALERGKADATLEELRTLEAALQAHAVRNALPDGTVVPPADLVGTVLPGTDLAQRLSATGPFVGPLGNVYPDLIIGVPLQVPEETAAKFPKLTREGFWEKYYPLP